MSQKQQQAKRQISPVIQLPPNYPAFFVIGKKGAGKSSLLERLLEIYYLLGYVILDWNCAFDLESLHWCVKGESKRYKDKVVEGRAYPILIIIPRTTQITIYPRKITMKDGREVDAVKLVYDDTPLRDIIKMAHEERRVCIFTIHLYKPRQRGQFMFSKYIEQLPEVMRDDLPGNINVAIGLRELADLSSNRMKTFRGDSEKESKRALNFFSRQMRHARCTGIFDMQNPDDVYGALVAQEDFILIKRLNRHHIPEKLQYLTKHIAARRSYAMGHYMIDKLGLVSLDRISKNSYYCVWPDGHFSMEHNHEPRFRHHKARDDAQALAGVKIRTLTKDEAKQEGGTSAKIVQIQERETAKAEYFKKLQFAFDIYRKNKTANPNYGWHDCARDADFLGKDNKPSGEGLRVAIKRAGEADKLVGYKEWTDK